MTINLKMPDITELKPKITVFGTGGAGGNAVNNMIESGLKGVEFVVANTDAQALSTSAAERIIQMGVAVTEGLGAGSQPEVGRAAAEEAIDEINDHLSGAHMVFITAGMGGGTGTGAAPVIAQAARDLGILTVGVVTKPFDFEGKRRMKVAEAGIEELQSCVDTLIVIPNQNLFRIANERTTFAEAFAMADQVLYSGVACITDLMVKEGLINLDFADVRAVMRNMGKAMMGTGEASGDKRAIQAAEAAIANPLLDEISMRGARGLLISITGGNDLTLFEVDEAATRIREEVDPEANIILGATFDESLEGVIRVSVVATGIDQAGTAVERTAEAAINDLTERLRKPKERPVQIQAQRPEPQAYQPEPSYEHAQAADLQDDAPESFVSQDEQDFYADEAYYGHEEPQQAIEPQTPHGGPRLPRVEDFPLVAQREMRAHGMIPGAAEAAPEAARRKPGLLGRLAQNFARRDEEPEAQQQPQREAPAPAREPVSEFAKPAPRPQAPAPQQRHAPQVASAPRRPAAVEDDQYEIPAFLRRQAN
ncbi:cell division protein FtsZ [Lutibaculum baratangense]|uniref:Cell division protein FtsZ n=1 Tax=Lutibaculum baratangense AMV1 TaxID=631454 RepID=V4RWD6_9HYPH|nr:cell division protein FtsZ [Lutibaculum baratangense]ESR27325.1 Cell division protein FtsZ [Lutibaculum baratangense AMV1]